MNQRTRDVCTCCGKRRMLNMISDDVWLCQECTDDFCTFCDICEEYWNTDFTEFTELPDGRRVCQYCLEEYDNDLQVLQERNPG